jgi:hypothetical protein
MGMEQLRPSTAPAADENVWAEQVDTDPKRWMAHFVTFPGRAPVSCRHRHHTEHAALACGDARRRAMSRAERYQR